MKNKLRLGAAILACALLLTQMAGAIFGGILQNSNQKNATELRGVWVASVFNIDFPSQLGLTAQQQKQELDDIIENAQYMGLNAIFFQVRPSSDALYASKIFPWSQFLTGTQGKENDQGFDPLSYLIEQGHQKGIQIHAWVNPLRVTTGTAQQPQTDESALAENHPVRKDPSLAVAYSDGRLYYDPSNPNARKLIVDGLKEIVENYDVDGVHYDDYFYPGEDFPDEEAYQASGSDLSLEDWRRENINVLIRESYEGVKEVNPQVAFGVSPGGIWASSENVEGGMEVQSQTSSYLHQYADSKRWVEEHWVDYIAPQIYWNIGYAPADYAKIAAWWSRLCAKHKVKLYVGHAAYKVGDGSQSEVWLDEQELPRQIAWNRENGGVDGSIFYGYEQLEKNVLGCKDQLHRIYVEEESVDTGMTLAPSIDAGSLLPKEDITAGAGTVVKLQCQAPAGASGVWAEVGPYQIQLKKRAQDQQKTGLQRAVYEGSFTLPKVAEQTGFLGRPFYVMEYGGKYDIKVSPYAIRVAE